MDLQPQDILTVSLTEEDKGKRLDRALADHVPDGISRARIQALMLDGQIKAEGKVFSDPSKKVQGTEVFEITLPAPEPAIPEPQAIDLDIVFEDEDILVLNKPPGLVVHPAAGNPDGTLVNALLAHCGETLSGIGGVRRPGIVHRLDKETSGLMVVAKNDRAHHGLSRQLSSRVLTRIYQALVWGIPQPPSGRIETAIGRSRTNRKKMAVVYNGGKEAITEYQVKETYGLLASLVECRLKTGRTHQIRVHMAHLKHWIIGDPVYKCPSVQKQIRSGKGKHSAKMEEVVKTFPRQALHAAELRLEHPLSGKMMTFTADMPKDMVQLISALHPEEEDS